MWKKIGITNVNKIVQLIASSKENINNYAISWNQDNLFFFDFLFTIAQRPDGEITEATRFILWQKEEN